jgi:hypothetical protein
MSERAELEKRRDELAAELRALEERIAAAERGPDDPELDALERDRAALLAKTEALEAELLEGRHRLTALREDLERVRSLSPET